MKTSIVIVLVLALSACTGIDSTVNTIDRLMNPPKFDSNEYGALVTIRQLAEKVEVCENKQEQILLAREIKLRVDWAKKYSEFLPNNDDSFKMLTSLDKEVGKFDNMAKNGGTSSTFCKLTLENINEQATVIQKSVAHK